MARAASRKFDPATFLAQAGPGRQLFKLKPNQAFFAQGGPADSIFYLQTGCAKLTVVSEKGLEATIALFSAGDFLGEEAMDEAVGVRRATARAITPCVALRIDRGAMIRIMREPCAFSDLFFNFLLARSMRNQADLINQIFDSSEKRLSRVLMLMAEFGKPSGQEIPILAATQETLAEVLGARHSSVSFFINRFRKLASIDFNGRIHVHGSLLNVMLRDKLLEGNGPKPPAPAIPRRESTARKPRRGARITSRQPDGDMPT
jgi:CRP/FNR family transcriptional regulator, cyclic AMP receptor protein